jgi:hypothetical protein
MAAYDENAKVILNNRTADDMELMRTCNEQEYEELFSECNFKTFVFTLRIEYGTCGDEQCVTATMVGIQEVSIRQEFADLISAIEKVTNRSRFQTLTGGISGDLILLHLQQHML